MANTKSAKKRARQTPLRTLHNREFKLTTKRTAKSFLKSLANPLAKHSEELKKEELKKAVAIIQRVATKGIIHKNKAANMVARLSKALHRATTKTA